MYLKEVVQQSRPFRRKSWTHGDSIIVTNKGGYGGGELEWLKSKEKVKIIYINDILDNNWEVVNNNEGDSDGSFLSKRGLLDGKLFLQNKEAETLRGKILTRGAFRWTLNGEVCRWCYSDMPMEATLEVHRLVLLEKIDEDNAFVLGSVK